MTDIGVRARPLKLKANIRFEKPDAKVGYIWGKPTSRSSILRGLNGGEWVEDPAQHPWFHTLGIEAGDTVAERWIVSDDHTHPSCALLGSGDLVPLPTLLEQAPGKMLGEEHCARFGPYLGTVMKLLDTHEEPARGGLSVQVHPPDGYVGRPAKPEMWKGVGKLYLGWKRDMTEAQVRAAIVNREIEPFLNAVDLRPDDLVLVPGGLVHAIRADTFTAEWSMAPTRADVEGGNDLSRATATVFDGTDGRTPRPGKEDISSALDIMRGANGFAGSSKLTVDPVPISLSDDGDSRAYMFRTAHVFVEQWKVLRTLRVKDATHAMGVYVEDGSVELIGPGADDRLELQAGDEAFIPACVADLRLLASRPSTLHAWYAPSSKEIATLA
jgi:mannose-6-phosphate isomerase class I